MHASLDAEIGRPSPSTKEAIQFFTESEKKERINKILQKGKLRYFLLVDVPLRTLPQLPPPPPPSR